MKGDYKKLLDELKSTAQRDELPLETVEQDYAISFLLKAMSESPDLAGSLVFRGGTALRKCYFANYRYSMDLDYSVRESVSLEEYNCVLEKVAETAQELLLSSHPGNQFEVFVKLIRGRDARNDNQDSHKFVVKFPWHAKQKDPYRGGRTIKLDTSHSEPVLLKAEQRSLIHPYSTGIKSDVLCLCMDELLAEKYVAMCHVAHKIEGLQRQSTRPRDYFDFEYGLSYAGLKNKTEFLYAAMIKADRRGLQLRSIEELTSSSSLSALERDWEPFLGDVVSKLDGCRQTIKELQRKMKELFPDFADSLKASRRHAEALKANRAE
jgi:predicted nucleotidyltransferase component of viral defense system